MKILASASVPPASRLDDADTTNLTAVQRPADIRFPVNPSYAGRAAVPTDHREAEEAAWWSEPLADHLAVAARARALFEADATPGQMAAQLGVTEDEATDLVIDDIARETGWERGVGLRPAPGAGGNPALCPPWCTKTSHADEDEERLHSSTATAIGIEDGTHLRETLTVVVQLDAFESPELPGGIDPTSIYLSVTCDRDRDTWAAGNMTPEQAERIGQALLDAARTARQASA
ncbi:DUF6907 domain-containing protein [Micromonospora trifolii]|uniref:DUF6907 domain-containing protein n=1 Tax=Micromonospora trifolii TaxID=2911208 RepID=UPI003D2F1409